MTHAAKTANPRRRNHQTGLLAEWQCRLALRLKGYRILAARARTPLGEIDIVAARGDVIAIVEVKARRNRDSAAAALDARQRGRLQRGAQFLLGHRPELAQASVIRFDLMLVAPGRWPEHIVNAWEGR